MGTPDFAVPTLAALIEAGHKIAAVYSQPPRKAGRGQAERPSPVQAFALKKGLEVRTPVNFKDERDRQAFADLNLDAAIVVAYGLILPGAILSAPRLGCFNLHASLLPRWRGAAPIQRAIMAGDKVTGAMVMQMDEGLDTGPVLATRQVEIAADTTAGALHDKLAHEGAALMVTALKGRADGSLEPVPQSEDGVTYAAKIDKAEAKIDWTKPAAELDCHIRGLSPFPGAYFDLNGNKSPTRIKVLRATPVAGAKGAAPGELLNDRLTVACGGGALRLEEVQRAGKAPMTADAFLRGNPLAKGVKLG